MGLRRRTQRTNPQQSSQSQRWQKTLRRHKNSTEKIDLMQFHTWEDRWLTDERLPRAIEEMRASGKATAVGISINRWEPHNGIRAVLEGQVDAVQVIYNIFDQ